jgi:hypothetical protein
MGNAARISIGIVAVIVRTIRLCGSVPGSVKPGAWMGMRVIDGCHVLRHRALVCRLASQDGICSHPLQWDEGQQQPDEEDLHCFHESHLVTCLPWPLRIQIKLS